MTYSQTYQIIHILTQWLREASQKKSVNKEVAEKA